jgi:hypothetical protein
MRVLGVGVGVGKKKKRFSSLGFKMEKKKERKALPPFSWSFRDFFPLISVVDFFFPHCVCIRALDRAPPRKKTTALCFAAPLLYAHSIVVFVFVFVVRV